MRRYLGAALLVAAQACGGTKVKPPTVQTAVVTARDIIIDAQATGVVEPINVVEVKSKAGGAIMKLPVETGSLVKTGDLLVQIDPRDAQNKYNQAKATLNAAQAKLNASEANKKRQDELFKARVITALEHETAATDYENAKSSVINAQANVDIMQQGLDDATVTAPSSGTIIDKTVSVGTVIASATNSVSGGTTLLKMADLNVVRIRASFNETDIGSIRGGQPASVTFDAYQNRTFQGMVEKIEPQAVVQQNVTMFPVLITLDNREGLLKPGMNGEVSVLIDQRDGVLAVPNDALKNPREAAATAVLLGLNPDTVQAELRAQGGGGGRGGFNRGGTNGGGTPGAAPAPGATPVAGTTPRTSGGEVALVQQGGQQDPQQGGRGGRRGGRGGGFQMPTVTEADCVKLDNEWKKHPKEKKQIDDLRAEQQKARAAGADREVTSAITEKMRPIYQAIGIDMMANGGCRRLRGEDAGGGRGGPGGGGGGGGGGANRQGGNPGGGAQRTAGGQGGAPQLQTSPEMGGMRQRTRSGLVFVAEGTTFHPRLVQLGQGNFDYTEVVSGLKEGEKVALLAALALQVQRQQQNDRQRQNANPLGGATQPPGGGRGPGGPGGGGAGGGGGGAPRGGGRG